MSVFCRRGSLGRRGRRVGRRGTGGMRWDAVRRAGCYVTVIKRSVPVCPTRAPCEDGGPCPLDPFVLLILFRARISCNAIPGYSLRASKKSAGATGDRTQQKTAHQRHAVVCAGGHGNFERLPYIVRLEPGGATHIVRKPKASWNFGSALESAWTAATPTPADRAIGESELVHSSKLP